MSRSGRAFGSLGIGELLTAKAGALLLLGAFVAVAAVLYGNAYAGSGHAEEEEAEHAAEEGEQGEAAERAERAEEEANEGSRSIKVTESVLISTAGAGLVPLGLLLARRRTRSGDEPAPVSVPAAPAAGLLEPVREAGIEPVVRPALALLSTGAAVIHFVVIPGHWDEYRGQGLFFVIAAIAQLLWAVWVLVARRGSSTSSVPWEMQALSSCGSSPARRASRSGRVRASAKRPNSPTRWRPSSRCCS
jgi:hypothetical protein